METQSFSDPKFLVTLVFLFLTILALYYLQYRKPLSGKKCRKMTSVGLTTLVTETETNLSIAIAILTFERKITLQDFIAKFNQVIKDNPTLYQRIRCVVKNGFFVEMDNYNVEMNVDSADLGKNQTPLEYAEQLANTPLQLDRPLWKCNLIEDYEGKAYAVWRLHHCIGDGVSVGMMFAKMMDNFDEVIEKMQPPANPTNTKIQRKPANSNRLQILSSFIEYLKKLVRFSMSQTSTLFNRKGGKMKSLRFTRDLTVSRAKAIGRQYGGTLNDVLLTCIAGATRTTLHKYDPTSLHPKLTLQCAIPVDMRPLNEEIKTTRNKFSSYVVSLPVGIEDPVDRLKQVVREMNRVKSSAEKYITYAFAQFLGLCPAILAQTLVRSASKKVSMGVTNVRGHPLGLQFCGRNIDVVGFMPPPPGVNIGICIASSGDILTVSLLTDKSVLQDPDEFLDNLLGEFKQLEKNLNKTKQ